MSSDRGEIQRDARKHVSAASFPDTWASSSVLEWYPELLASVTLQFNTGRSKGGLRRVPGVFHPRLPRLRNYPAACCNVLGPLGFSRKGAGHSFSLATRGGDKHLCKRRSHKCLGPITSGSSRPTWGSSKPNFYKYLA